jgi:hypothetical protein
MTKAIENLSTEELLLVARQLAETDWNADQLRDVAALTQDLLAGVNALARFGPADELPALRYELPEWE